MRINYDLADLRAFYELARLGQFTRTAEALSITTSALSRRIAKLEEALGGRLVDRTTRSVSLTPVGRRLLARLTPVLENLDDCMLDAARLSAGLEGKIVVSCFASLAHSLFPTALARFHERFPNVQVCLRDGNGTQVMDAVLLREAEFGLTTMSHPIPDLVEEHIATDQYMLVCPENHPLARRGKLTWTELAEYRVLSFNPNGSSRRQIDSILETHGIAKPWFDEVDQLSSMIGHLESGKFIAVLPSLLTSMAKQTVAVTLVEPSIERKFGLIRRRDTLLNTAGQALWDLLKNNMQNGSPL